LLQYAPREFVTVLKEAESAVKVTLAPPTPSPVRLLVTVPKTLAKWPRLLTPLGFLHLTSESSSSASAAAPDSDLSA
jgi:hypothetical protein